MSQQCQLQRPRGCPLLGILPDLQAFTLYEEAVPDTKSEVAALHSIAGALHACRVFGPDSRGALAHKATGFSAKLLRRGDQCRAVLACSHLFWQPEDAPAAAAEVRQKFWQSPVF